MNDFELGSAALGKLCFLKFTRALYFTALVTFGLLLLIRPAKAQDTHQARKKTITQPSLPSYLGGSNQLLAYFSDQLFPIIAEYYERDGSQPTDFVATLTINVEGAVTSVHFDHIEVSESCKDDLRNNIRSMKNWMPACSAGKPIKGEFKWRMSCILWE